ncbi:MAG: FAD binding domain-containing protein [Pseudomonadota bacterium]
MSYLAPTKIADAIDYLGARQATIIAGCTDYFPARQPHQIFDPLLDITRLEGFRGISETENAWRLGAATTWTDLIKAPLPTGFDGLKLAAREVGSVQIQNRGTLAGNICNASPAADGIPPLLALDAQVEITGKEGTRILALGAFIKGARDIALGPAELVSAILIPKQVAQSQSAFLKLGSRTHLVISIAMVAVCLELSGKRITSARVAVGSCSPMARRLPELERFLAGKAAIDITAAGFDAEEHFAPLSPITDVRGSAEYRLDAVPELCRRAVFQAMAAA